MKMLFRRPPAAIARALACAAVLALTSVPSAHARTGDVIGEMHEYFTWKEDEDLLDVARADELGVIELMAANPGIDPWHPGREQRILLPTMHIIPDAPRQGVVINIAELRMYYFSPEDGPLTFPLGVGRDGFLTPTGTTKIVRKKENPNWYLTPSEVRDHPELPKVIPPGPDNPLGEFAMYLGWPSYLIHGTNSPWGIGRRASRGCIRMYPEDIAWLYERLPIGTQVTVVNQPVKLGWKDDELYIQVHPSSMQVDQMEETSRSPGPPDPIPVAQQTDRINAAAGDQQSRLDWGAVEKALFERMGYPVRITTPAPPPPDAGTASSGAAASGTAASGSAASGSAVSGSAASAGPANGSAPTGSAPTGSAGNGTVRAVSASGG